MPRAKPHPGRKRRLIAWALLSLAALTAAIWLASGWWWVGYNGNGVSCSLSSGTLNGFVGQTTPANPFRQGFHAGSLAHTMQQEVFPPPPKYLPRLRWGDWNWQRLNGFGLVGTQFSMPLWPLPLLFTAAGLPFLRSGIHAYRRARIGLCTKCGYDKRGIPPTAPCPECGKA